MANLNVVIFTSLLVLCACQQATVRRAPSPDGKWHPSSENTSSPQTVLSEWWETVGLENADRKDRLKRLAYVIPEVEAPELGKLSACVIAEWRFISEEDLRLGGFIRREYKLTIRLQIRYGGVPVFLHRFDTNELFAPLIRKSEIDSFDPESERDPYPLLLEPKNLWTKLSDFSHTSMLLNPSLLVATKALVEHKLKLLQRELYGQVAKQFTELGDPIQQEGERLSGSRILWTSYLLAGFPLSIESNEILRSQALGDEALLAGAATDALAISFDNIQDIYTYFSIRPEDPPAENIIEDIQHLSDDRLEALHSTIIEIIEAIVANGQHEPPELFAPTLLRLSLIHS